MTTYSVGQPFPGPVPPQEGAVLELTAGGPVILIQAPGLSRPEVQAFKKSFRRYGYWQPPGLPVPFAVWVFDFPAPLGAIDVNFDSRRADPQHIADYLDETAGLKNAWTIHLLDGPILRANKLVGLQPDAIRMFMATIRAQVATPYSQADYDRYLAGIYNYTSAELLTMGMQFRHK